MTTPFHNRFLHLFGKEYYENILGKENLVEEIVIENKPYWYANRNNKKYLLRREIIDKLPIKVREEDEVHHSGKVYYEVMQYQTVVFKSEKNYSFRELVDLFCDFEHTNKEHFLLYKILCIATYLERINYRVCTNAGFGKDSVWEVLHILKRDVSIINPRSMPALEYRLNNKVLVINELSNIGQAQTDLIQEFLLLCGDMRTSYEKSTRAGVKTTDYYTIQNLSLVCMYNELSYYEEIGKANKFFDYMFTKAVADRFIPFKFEGRLSSKQFIIRDDEKVCAENNRVLYLKVLRTFEYYKLNWRKELKPWKNNVGNLGLTPRQENNLRKIFEFVNLYSETPEEYKTLCNALYKAHTNYETMLQKGNHTLNRKFYQEKPIEVQEEDMT